MSTNVPQRDKIRTVLRSALAGAAATLADLGVLAVAVGALGVSARVANVPALLVGAVVQFFGNRHFAFKAREGRLGKQAMLFALSEVVTLALNGAAYDLVARSMELKTAAAMCARLAISFAVFVCWSYPVWRRVFAPPLHLADSHPQSCAR